MVDIVVYLTSDDIYINNTSIEILIITHTFNALRTDKMMKYLLKYVCIFYKNAGHSFPHIKLYIFLLYNKMYLFNNLLNTRLDQIIV